MSEEKQLNNQLPPLVLRLARYLPTLILLGLAVNLLLPQFGNFIRFRCSAACSGGPSAWRLSPRS